MLYFGIAFIIIGLLNAYWNYRYWRKPDNADSKTKGWDFITYTKGWIATIFFIIAGIVLILRNL